jgi:hypothetical protein
MNRFIIIVSLLVLTSIITCADSAPATSASTAAKPAAVDQGFGKVKSVTIDGTTAVDTPGSATYTNAHLVTDNGSTLDTLKLKAFFNQTDNTLQKVVATGNVKGTFTQTTTKRKYTVYANEGVYDPKLDQIMFTGSVKILIDSSYTKGPLVQTGTTALVQLGDGPDFPVITTNDVKTTFTVSQ